ncbi:MAG: tetratricopeptide repeat protein [Rhizobiaceae bacterium]
MALLPTRAARRKNISMLTFKKQPFTTFLATAFLFSLSFGIGVGGALAFDPEVTFRENKEPRTVLRYGFRALQQGKMADAIGAFRFGAKRNDLASEWKLARMLQSGMGIKKNDYAAHKLYVKIANRYIQKAPTVHDQAYVSSAVIALGRYSLVGIKGTRIRINLRRAEGYFFRAAALYKDPSAQYELGRLYRGGALGVKQPRSAARWLSLAARKGHAKAQAELGEMLFYGEGIRRRPVRGLVYMTKAATHSAQNGLKYIRKMRRTAFAHASVAQRAAANKIIGKFSRQTVEREGEISRSVSRSSGAGVSKASQGE